MEENQPEYSQFVRLMYQKGFYVYQYNIDLTSYEVYFFDNKICIIPIAPVDEDIRYVFTGTSQKTKILSKPTEFSLYLEDDHGKEFEDHDHIMLSIVKDSNIENLFTRNYSSWRFGLTFNKGIHLDSDRYLILQSHKNIGLFDIDIKNIDLFKKKIIDNRSDKMMWLD